MKRYSSDRTFAQRRRLLVKTSPRPDVVATELVREQLVPQPEISERMWWATAEALNSDIDPSFNALGTYPDELAALYARLRGSLGRFEPREKRASEILEHAVRWRVRSRDVEDSLRLAHIEESTLSSFDGPRLQMPLIAYRSGPRDDLVRVGPQHEDPQRLVELARRRIRRIKGWSLKRIALAEHLSDWRVAQSSLKVWRLLEREVP